MSLAKIQRQKYNLLPQYNENKEVKKSDRTNSSKWSRNKRSRSSKKHNT